MGLEYKRSGGVLTALMVAVSLSGCASSDTFDSNERWFSKPFNVVSRNGGYTYSELKEADSSKPITANDLVDAHGACPPLSGTAAAAAGPSAAGASGAAPAPNPDVLMGQGVALGMSECDVIYRAGAPSSVRLGSNPNGDRTAVLTYNSGPRAGTYHFERGRLMGIDEAAAAEPAPAPKVGKKKKKSVAEGREQISIQ